LCTYLELSASHLEFEVSANRGASACLRKTYNIYIYIYIYITPYLVLKAKIARKGIEEEEWVALLDDLDVHTKQVTTVERGRSSRRRSRAATFD